MMSTKKLKPLLLLTALVIITMAMTSTVYGGTVVKKTVSGASNFSKAWSKPKIAEGNHLGCPYRMDYDYNTFAINEDVVMSYWSGAQHRAKIINAKTGYGPWRVARGISDLEIRHVGNTVNYYIDKQ